MQVGAAGVPRGVVVQRAVPVAAGQRAGRAGGPAAGAPAARAAGHGRAAAALQGTRLFFYYRPPPWGARRGLTDFY